MEKPVKKRETLLKEFAKCSDKLFTLGIIRTDSFTGEIGEFIASRYFKLDLADRSTKAYDAVCSKGYKYQIKSKVTTDNHFNYRLSNLKYQDFDFLVVVFFDSHYNTLAILKIPSDKINSEQYLVSSAQINPFSQDITKLKLSQKEQHAIGNFAQSYLDLQNAGIIRSRKVVGDIGEYYACKHLKLQLCDNKNEKGFDAVNQKGLTFEIKTRRVYESGRRTSETRRLNNLSDKSADYLVVVTLNHAFECSGMWIMPMKNVVNPKSANLKIVNTTAGIKNIVSSQISWLTTGEKFVPFNDMKKQKSSPLSQSNKRAKTTKKVSSKDSQILDDDALKKIVSQMNIAQNNNLKAQEDISIEQEEFSYWRNTPGTSLFIKLPIYIVLLIIVLVLFGYILDQTKKPITPEPWPKITQEDNVPLRDKNTDNQLPAYPKINFDNTIKIKSKGKTIKVSPEQVLEQIDIDYDDLRDYLGDELR